MNEEELRERMAKCINRVADRAREWAEEVAIGSALKASSRCKSPIEEMFFIAYSVLMAERGVRGSPQGGRAIYLMHPPEFKKVPTIEPWATCPSKSLDDIPDVWERNEIACQVPIGPYTADFVIARAIYEGRGFIIPPRVVVECDGHDFHERTKEQAARDKARDRFLATEGFHVLRFTGSEIYRDPAKCAADLDEFFDSHVDRVCHERNEAGKAK